MYVRLGLPLGPAIIVIITIIIENKNQRPRTVPFIHPPIGQSIHWAKAGQKGPLELELGAQRQRSCARSLRPFSLSESANVQTKSSQVESRGRRLYGAQPEPAAAREKAYVWDDSNGAAAITRAELRSRERRLYGTAPELEAEKGNGCVQDDGRGSTIMRATSSAALEERRGGGKKKGHCHQRSDARLQ